MQKTCLALLGALMSMPVSAETPLARLTVMVRGLAPATGTIEVSLFDSADSFFRKPLLQQSEPVTGSEEISVEFTGLASGDYAVVVVHDENGNGALDNGFLGFGGESYGYSNNATSWFGLRPGFDAARFSIGADDLEIVVKLE